MKMQSNQSLEVCEAPATSKCTENNSQPKTGFKKLRSVKQFFALTKEDATPVNWSIILQMFFVMFASAFSLIFYFPYLPDMVVWFGYKEEEKGYYAGFIVSAFFAGRVTGSYFWGWLSDKTSRKLVILVNLGGICVFSIAFGFSTTVTMAIALRFATGLFNGLVGVIKSTVYEITDNTNQAIGISVTTFGWGVGLIVGPLLGGYLANPVKHYHHVFGDNHFLKRFPYILPAFTLAAVSLLAFFIILWKLPVSYQSKVELELETVCDEKPCKDSSIHEQNQVRKIEDNEDTRCEKYSDAKNVCATSKPYSKYSSHKPLNDEDIGAQNQTATSTGRESEEQYCVNISEEERKTLKSPTKNTDENITEVTEESSLMPEVKITGECNVSDQSKASKQTFDTNLKYRGNNKEAEHRSSINPASKRPQAEKLDLDNENQAADTVSVEDLKIVVVKSTQIKRSKRIKKQISGMVLCRLFRMRTFMMTAILYCISGFAVVGFEEIFAVWASTAKRFNGLGYEPDEIGRAIGLAAIPALVLQIYLFPKMEVKFGAKMTHYISCGVMLFITTVMPAARILIPYPSVLLTTLCILMAAYSVSSSNVFAATFLLLNNSVDVEIVGSANGIAMTMASLARTMAPTLGGSLFSWSITDGARIGFPFDVNMVFVMYGFLCLTANVVCSFLPKALDRQKGT